MVGMRVSPGWASLLIAAACGSAPAAPPAMILRMPTPFAHADLTESSGLAVSRRHPGVLWSHNDSDHDALLFATDTLGIDHGTVRVSGATNEDWEDLAIGPCGARTCLYIGDIGDNPEQRTSVRVYRVEEPDLGASATAPAAALEIQYPDGPHDAEALYVDTLGDLYVITKGRTQGILHFRVPAAAWRAARALAEPLGQLPLDPQGTLLDMVTAADISPDNTRVAVRTYRRIYLLPRAADGRLLHSRGPPCTITGLESQGEGLAWLDNAVLALTSERGHLGPGTVTVLRCGTRGG